MSEISPTRSIVVIFVPFDGSPNDFAAKLREWFPSAKVPRFPVQASQTEIADVATEKMPLWMWFVPNPRPKDSGSLFDEDRL
jgi:hypothetical protein